MLYVQGQPMQLGFRKGRTSAYLLPAPMQLPTHGQKWSNMATQRLLTAQCFALSGRTICGISTSSPQAELKFFRILTVQY